MKFLSLITFNHFDASKEFSPKQIDSILRWGASHLKTTHKYITDKLKFSRFTGTSLGSPHAWERPRLTTRPEFLLLWPAKLILCEKITSNIWRNCCSQLMEISQSNELWPKSLWIDKMIASKPYWVNISSTLMTC